MIRFYRIISKIGKKLYWILDKFLWLLPTGILRLIIGTTKQKMGLTVSITTYIERFESCFKPLLVKVCELFPQEQIIVVANGYYDLSRQKKYLIELREFCSRYHNVDLYDYYEPVSLSQMANTLLINMKNDVNLSLNEDVSVSTSLRRFLIKSRVSGARIATLNNSWCHILISEQVFKVIGYFDERLPEMGGEDDDYAARCALAGIEIANNGKNKFIKMSNYSYKPYYHSPYVQYDKGLYFGKAKVLLSIQRKGVDFLIGATYNTYFFQFHNLIPQGTQSIVAIDNKYKNMGLLRDWQIGFGFETSIKYTFPMKKRAAKAESGGE